MGHTVVRSAVFLVLTSCAWAASVPGTTAESQEDFRIEAMCSAWNINSSGNLSDSSNVVNLQNDLGISQGVETFYGKLVLKPGRKHRLFVEGAPFSLNGNKTSTRTFTYAGQTYSFNEQLLSKADLTYVFGGYQYDFLSGPAGHLGASVGGVYLNATGMVNAPQANVNSSRSQQIGLPLAGIEGRVFPLPGHRFLDLDGGVRGMDFGGYGHYVEFDVNAGVWVGRRIGFQGGYRSIAAYLHDNSSSLNGSIDVRLTGPAFSLLFKW